MKKVSYLLSAVILLSVNAKAQRMQGVATSDWSTMNGLAMNPANIADSREKIAIDVFSVSSGIENNLGSFGSVSDLITTLRNGNAGSLFNYSGRQTFSLMAPYAEVRGPGVMYSINHKHSIALTTGLKVFNQFNNFDQSLFRTLVDPNYTYNTSNTGDIDLTSKNFNYTVQSYAQLGLSYGVVLLEEREHTLKAGVTLRYLRGIGYVSMKGDNLDAHYRNNNDSAFVTKSDLEFASNLLSTRSAFTDGFTTNNVISNIFGANSGSGIGGDVGLVYEYMPMSEKNKRRVTNDTRYKLKLSASVTDIGAITYKNASNSNANVTGNGYISPKGLDTVHTFDEFRTYAKNQGFTADTSSHPTKVYLPTALVLGADYNIQGNWYVNATYMMNVANRENVGNSYYNQVTVTPRYDVKLFSVAVPVSYSALTEHVKVGLGLRLTGFYIGSDDMIAVFAKNQYSFNLYAGGYVPLFRQKRHGNNTDTADLIPEPDMEHGGGADTANDCPDKYEAMTTVPKTMILAATGNSNDTNAPHGKAAVITDVAFEGEEDNK